MTDGGEENFVKAVTLKICSKLFFQILDISEIRYLRDLRMLRILNLNENPILVGNRSFPFLFN